ncbi:salt tolerance down-regulator-domain-containing protein [Syncephalastrum racemosum]|uniref:Stress response protein NST1 n=1 Tax=Syncephalastrum racemosum TaxID=13706 RepID=A0A1X2H3C0_SYNRA|nr:salt tolerance down-regulator-domain-containing protein [Syncephalastrum racemosum]
MQMTKSMNLAKKQTSSYAIRSGGPPSMPIDAASIPKKKRTNTNTVNANKRDADLLESSNDQQDAEPTPVASIPTNNSSSNNISDNDNNNGDNKSNTNINSNSNDSNDNAKTSDDTGKPASNTTQECTDVPSDAVSKAAAKRKKKKKSKAKNASSNASGMRESHWLVDTRNNAVRNTGDEFWSSTNNSEERQKIREFWLQLGEEERRSLVKVEKEAVLRKMKEQQKHSCNCSVCGKKRTAIEDELEVLYDAYYEELEQYANHQQQTRFYNGVDRLTNPTYDVDAYEGGYIDPNILDEEDDDEDEEDEEDDYEDNYEDEDEEDVGSQSDQSDALSDGEGSSYDDDIPYSGSQLAHTSNDHFHFGNSLTVKGGILTVADDLLKNDGKKFLDMMERLAERRIQKEEEVLEQADEYYDEGDEEDDEAYDDDDDEDTRTEEQRMEEGRRMFQIFAARMFEQRVLAAYREKVARERQQRLIQELEEEERLERERELKKQKEKEKKRDKKRKRKRSG